jgi:formylglycine-generating enzyme required for sulfatase activity
MARSLSGRRVATAALGLALVWSSACGERNAVGSSDPPAATDSPAPASAGGGPASVEWAEVLDTEPDPVVVVDGALRDRLRATGLPWRVRDKVAGIELLLVPPGEFLRGAEPSDREAADDERPQHTVLVEAPFYLGRYEVTQDEWQRVLGDEPSFFAAPNGSAGQRFPVEQVESFRVQEFLAGTGFALPTESQWEYACRAGDPAPRYGALDDIAWHHGNAGGRPHAIGTRAHNALGLHDLLGNVSEWTSSGYLAQEYSRHLAPIDARRRALATPKLVVRGGSWYEPPKRIRASARYSVERDFIGGHVGFRVLREP